MGSTKRLETTHVQQLHFGSKSHEELELLQRVEGQTDNHRAYIKSIKSKKLTFCTGPAGAGKTWQAVGIAAEMLVRGRINRIVITRPMVPCGEEDRLGFLPGDKNAKVAPHMRPLLDAFDDFLGRKVVDKLIEAEVIEMVPLELMRGSNIRDAVIILDEAQNIEFKQLHMFLTRMAKGSKIVVVGDPTQTDLPFSGRIPLLRMMDLFRPRCHTEIAMVSLSHEDVMRDELVRWIDMRALGLPDEQEEFCTMEELEPEPLPVIFETCAWCGTDCGMNESPSQFECWNCTSLNDVYNTADNEVDRIVRTVLRSPVCTKAFPQAC